MSYAVAKVTTMSSMPWLDKSMSPWSTVRDGDVVQDKNGTPWVVEQITGATQRTVNLAREVDGKWTRARVVQPREGKVLVLLSAERARQLAVAKAKVTLGARVVGVPSPEGKGHLCPTDFDTPSALLAHTFLFHGEVIEEQQLSRMALVHMEMHRNLGEGFEPHVHTERF